MTVFINPSSDIFVKYLLGSERNKDLLISFINAVITDADFRRIVSVEIKNPFNIKNFSIDKESVVDIKATDETGRLFDIEVQSTGAETFKNRSLYYWARLYSEQLKESEVYSKLRPSVCINVLDFNLFKEIDYFHTCFLLREKDNPEFVLTDHLAIHFLELKKLNDMIVNNKLIKWLLFFKNEGKREDIMKILIKDDEDIAKAHQEYERFTQDEELKEMYEARLKWERDYNTLIESAKIEGLKQGIEQGIEQGELKDKRDILIRLIAKKFNLSNEEIDLIKSIQDRDKLDIAIDELFNAKLKEDILNVFK